MPILNYTTTIAVDKSVGEVSKILAKHGVASVSTNYNEKGQAAGLSFTLRTPHGERMFALPIDIAGVLAVLRNDGTVTNRYKDIGQAERIAWRIAKDWLEAQLALIAAGMASLDQIMLPYLVTPNGSTVYDNYKANEASLAIEVGGSN